jgi:NADPH-dependent ferric siderophore reductase/DNA-binding PadR family transcriptional regulator
MKPSHAGRHRRDGHRSDVANGPDQEGHSHRGARAQRLFDYGDLRLMTLALVAEQPRNGYQIMKEISHRFDGGYVPSPGAIYPVIAWLEDMNLATVTRNEDGQNRINATPAGQAFLQANAAELAGIWNRKHLVRRAQAPKEIVAAMDDLKASLGKRFATSRDAADVDLVARAIRDVAAKIADLAIAEAAPQPEIVTRHRLEPRRRSLTVQRKDRLTPHMIRIVFSGPDLTDFVSLAPDDHVKLFFPFAGEKPLMRDYTPRSFDTAAQTLAIDFAVHAAGPATDWAIRAEPGDAIEIGGPRGSSVIAPVFDWWLLIGDETALPAIGRRVEEMAPGTRVMTVAAVIDAADEQRFPTRTQLNARWVHRPESDVGDPAPLLAAVRTIDLPPGQGFVWIAAEAAVAKALKQHFLEERGHPGAHLKAAGYWTAGQPATGDKALD